MSKRSSDIATAIVDVVRRMGYDTVKTEAVSEFRAVFVSLRTGLLLVFGELLFEQKYCTVVVVTPLVVAKNDFPCSHLHHVQYYVTNYIPAAQTYANNFPRPSPPLQSGFGNETSSSARNEQG